MRISPSSKTGPLPIAAFAAVAIFVGLVSCSKDEVNKANPNEMSATEKFSAIRIEDPHSYARPGEALATHLDLDISVDFEKKKILGTAAYAIDNKTGGDLIVFDSRNLNVTAVTDETGDTLAFKIGAADPIMGSPLEVKPQAIIQARRDQLFHYARCCSFAMA